MTLKRPSTQEAYTRGNGRLTVAGARLFEGFWGVLRDFTNAISIAASGNVLIGTTTDGASKLVVADDSIQVNTAKTPATAGDTGTTGQIAWDASYIYVCVATDTWKRAAITTW